MIKFEKTETYGWEAAIRGMRNPLNSWGKSDSKFYANRDVDYGCDHRCETCEQFGTRDDHDPSYDCSYVGENDLKLMKTLADAGPVHAKYRRMITVMVDITAPLYWWKEFDTYKVGTVANSCSTMHKIADKEFTEKDFSCEHLFDFCPNNDTDSMTVLRTTIDWLNVCREKFIHTKDKEDWWQLIQLLPSSYNQKRTVMMNYEVLVGIYKWRRNHKLDEWHDFCGWIEGLPYSELITGGENHG